MSLTVYLDQDCPTSNQLSFLKTKNGTYRLYENIAIHYKKIAGTLGIDANKITLIEHGSSDDVSRVSQVFQEWFENADQLPNRQYYPLTWEGLREILKDSDLANVAERFFEVLAS